MTALPKATNGPLTVLAHGALLKQQSGCCFLCNHQRPKEVKLSISSEKIKEKSQIKIICVAKHCFRFIPTPLIISQPSRFILWPTAGGLALSLGSSGQNYLTLYDFFKVLLQLYLPTLLVFPGDSCFSLPCPGFLPRPQLSRISPSL